MKRNLGPNALGPFTDGVETNPQTSDVVADTGAITAGPSHPGSTALSFQITITAWCSAAASFSIQRRNTANNANVGDVVVIRVPADLACQYLFVYNLVSGERIRVLPTANITGTCGVTINGEQTI